MGGRGGDAAGMLRLASSSHPSPGWLGLGDLPPHSMSQSVTLACAFGVHLVLCSRAEPLRRVSPGRALPMPGAWQDVALLVKPTRPWQRSVALRRVRDVPFQPAGPFPGEARCPARGTALCRASSAHKARGEC